MMSAAKDEVAMPRNQDKRPPISTASQQPDNIEGRPFLGVRPPGLRKSCQFQFPTPLPKFSRAPIHRAIAPGPPRVTPPLRRGVHRSQSKRQESRLACTVDCRLYVT